MLIIIQNLENCALRCFCGCPKWMVIMVSFAIASESTLKGIWVGDRFPKGVTSVAAASAATSTLTDGLGSMVCNVAKSLWNLLLEGPWSSISKHVSRWFENFKGPVISYLLLYSWPSISTGSTPWFQPIAGWKCSGKKKKLCCCWCVLWS